MKTKRPSLLLTVLALLSSSTGDIIAQQLPVYQDVTQDIEARIEDALSRMTLREKIHTTFEIKNANLAMQNGLPTVTMDVTNTGNRAGAQVVQLYVQDVKASIDRPVKELKAFQKVKLNPGETQSVTLTLNERAFQFYDTESHSWKAEPGKFNFLIGTSSQDIVQTLAYELK